MASLDLEKEVIELKFNGEMHKIEKPNNGKIREYNKRVKGLEGEELEEMFTEFLGELGLKKEVYDQMTPAQSKVVIEALYSTEKN